MQVSTFSPLFRQYIGFDRFNDLFESISQSAKSGDTYPPYNIEKLGDNQYRIVMAVAGFKPGEIKVTAQEDELLVTGTTQQQTHSVEYLYKGIATRNFQRKFNLSDYIKVVGARIDDGLLTIDLLREIPESRRPRNIEITQGSGVRVEAGKPALETV